MSSAQEYNTIMKWYSTTKGYGFLDTKDEELGDIFIHAEVWKQARLTEVPKPNTPIVVKAMKLGKKLRATQVVSVG